MAAAGQPDKPKGWSELPKDLVVMIGERLSLFADYVRFRSVCVSWYAALATDVLNHHPSSSPSPSPSPSRQRQYFPFLFLHFYQDDGCSRGLLSLPENGKIYQLRGLPRWELSSMGCRGSSHGWLVIAGKDKPDMNLINPFTRAQLPLPPMNKFRDVKYNQPCFVGKEYSFLHDRSYLSVQKVVLSTSPSSSAASSQIQSSDVVAIAIFGRNKSQSLISRPGDKSWTCLPKAIFLDVLFYKDHLYAVTSNNKNGGGDIEILVINMDLVNGGGDGCPLLPKLVDTLKPPEGYPDGSRWRPYLVESCGDLLLVARKVVIKNVGPQPSLDYRPPIVVVHQTIGFRIFKLCPEGNTSDGNKSSSSSWVEINNLGDRMLFLGVNSSFSLSAHDFPGCKGNCIYFTPHHTDRDHYYRKKCTAYNVGGFDMGVFNLKDERIEPLPLEGCWKRRIRDPWDTLYPPPIWLIATTN